MTVLAVIVGMQTVGLVLMAAMLITPAAAARFWTQRLSRMLLIAMGIGAFSGWVGAGVSYFAPAMPTGPWIVLTASLIAFVSFIFAPKRGLWHRLRWQRIQSRYYRASNFLFCLAQTPTGQMNATKLRDYIGLSAWQFRRLSRKLESEGYITQDSQGMITQTQKAKNFEAKEIR
jgi:manganese/zinc/iron transport system permease protein